MGQESRQTVDEIERTRDELAQKVDELMGRARVEAGAVVHKSVPPRGTVAGVPARIVSRSNEKAAL